MVQTGNLRMMIVDDSAFMQNHLIKTLKEQGYQIVTASNGSAVPWVLGVKPRRWLGLPMVSGVVATRWHVASG